MVEIVITQIFGVMALTAIAVLLIISGYREYRLRKKVEVLKSLIENKYEYNEVDLNNYLK